MLKWKLFMGVTYGRSRPAVVEHLPRQPKIGRHDTQHDDTQNKDIQHNSK